MNRAIGLMNEYGVEEPRISVLRDVQTSEDKAGQFMQFLDENNVDIGSIADEGDVRNMVIQLISDCQNSSKSNITNQNNLMFQLQDRFNILESQKPEGFSRVSGSRSGNLYPRVESIDQNTQSQLTTIVMNQLPTCMGGDAMDSIMKRFLVGAGLLIGGGDPYNLFDFPEWFAPLMKQSGRLMDYCLDTCMDIFSGLTSRSASLGKREMSEEEREARLKYLLEHKKSVPDNWIWLNGSWCVVGVALPDNPWWRNGYRTYRDWLRAQIAARKHSLGVLVVPG